VESIKIFHSYCKSDADDDKTHFLVHIDCSGLLSLFLFLLDRRPNFIGTSNTRDQSIATTYTEDGVTKPPPPDGFSRSLGQGSPVAVTTASFVGLPDRKLSPRDVMALWQMQTTQVRWA